MVIPQSLAYALLAGLPAVVGLYASILPQLVYTLFGTSRTLAIGPVAIIALMTGGRPILPWLRRAPSPIYRPLWYCRCFPGSCWWPWDC